MVSACAAPAPSSPDNTTEALAQAAGRFSRCAGWYDAAANILADGSGTAVAVGVLTRSAEESEQAAHVIASALVDQAKSLSMVREARRRAYFVAIDQFESSYELAIDAILTCDNDAPARRRIIDIGFSSR